MELSPDTLLHDRYRIIRLLGQGGMGAVYLAHDTSLDLQVALKVNYRPGEGSSSQFYREARLLASLRHLHLPRVIDYFVIPPNQFLVMDYIPGEDLGTLIAREGRQPLDKVIAWARQLGDALVYLHSQKPPVVHRDIKPANIKITPAGELVLVDFGIAKAAETSQATSTGASGYTPGFAPPEQYGSTRTGPYTDQFSFAATLYMLLTGQRPADSIDRTLNQAALTPIREFNPEVPPAFEQAVLRGMSLRPEERFPSVRDFLTALTGEPAVDQARPVVEPTQTAPRPEETEGAAQKPPVEPVLRAPPGPGEEGIPDATLVKEQAESKAEPAAQQPPAPVEATIKGPPPTPLEATAAVFPPGQGDSPGSASVESPARTVQAAPPPAATIQTPLSQAAIPAAPAAAPKGKARSLPAMIIAGAVLLLALFAGGFFIIRGILNKSASPTAAPTLPVAAPVTSPTPTEPSASATPQPSLTTLPSDTPEPSSTPEPSATPTQGLQPIGGGGVVAFSSDRGGDGTLQIWTMRVFMDNSGRIYSDEPVQLTFDSGDKSQPAWSPDGKKLVYVAPGGGNFGLDIWVVNADGAGPVNITKKKGDDTDPAWSPDGKLIAFTNNGRDDGIRQVFSVAPDGSGLKRISFDQEEYMPAFSPDGKYLAFVLFAASHETLYLRSTASDYSDLTRFDNVELLGRLGYIEHPAYSPDGGWIAYTRSQALKSTRQDVYVVRAASRGGDIARLTEDMASREPAWSPDSRWIVFTSNRDGNPEVYIMSNNGQFQVNLSLSPGADMQPDWQPLPPG
jgi:serine/threonine protein kinase/Tol biopolymer transport system component